MKKEGKKLPKISLLICAILLIGAIWSMIYFEVIQQIIYMINSPYSQSIDRILSYPYILILDLLLLGLAALIIARNRYLFMLLNITGIFALVGFYLIGVGNYESWITPLIEHFTTIVIFSTIVILVWLGLYFYFNFAKKKGVIDFK